MSTAHEHCFRHACFCVCKQESFVEDNSNLRCFAHAWDAGLALFYLGQFEEAMAAYDMAIHLAPGNESLVAARAESKASLLERNLSQLTSKNKSSDASLPASRTSALPKG